MELRHLRYFVAVAEELHFRRAAERLHIAQPPLSVQIAQLEKELCARLFERERGRGVRLTQAGAVFLDDARQILGQASTAVERVRRANQGQIGRLSAGMTSAMAYGPVPTILQRFRSENPDVALQLTELTTAQQEDALLNRMLDVGFCYAPLSNPSFATILAGSERLVVALSAAHPLTRHASLGLARLREEEFLSFPRTLSPGLYDLIGAAYREAGIAPAIRQEATQLQTLIALVCAGVGVAIVPESMSILSRPGVAYRPIRGRTPRVDTLLVWRGGENDPAIARLIALVRRGIQPAS